jgi:hypothetical protein
MKFYYKEWTKLQVWHFKRSLIILQKYLIVSRAYHASKKLISFSYFLHLCKILHLIVSLAQGSPSVPPYTLFVEAIMHLIHFPFILPGLPGKFREEFKAAFSCCCLGVHHRQEDRLTRGRTSTESRKSLTTQISNFDNLSKLSEQVVLTSISTLPSANGAGPPQSW